MALHIGQADEDRTGGRVERRHLTASDPVFQPLHGREDDLHQMGFCQKRLRSRQLYAMGDFSPACRQSRPRMMGNDIENVTATLGMTLAGTGCDRIMCSEH